MNNGPPFDADYQLVKTWVDDVIHITTIFGDIIMELPEFVYAFIPPLCPTSSVIYKFFATTTPLKIICGSYRSKTIQRYCPKVVRFSPALGLAAVTFRASHLTIFPLNENDNLEKLCCLKKRGFVSRQTSAM